MIIDWLLVWLLKLCTLCSQVANALLFNGNVDETISGRVHREQRYRLEYLIDKLFWVKPNHCKRSHEKDITFAEFIMKCSEDGYE